MKIVHLDLSLESGGAEIALVRLVKAAAWEPVLVVPQIDGRTATGDVYAEVRDAVTVRHLGEPTAAGASKANALALAKLATALLRDAQRARSVLRREQPALIHANTSRAAAVAWIATRRTSVPLVVHLRDHVDRESLGEVGFAALKRAVRAARGVIANSESTLASAAPFMSDGARAVVLPSPIGAPSSDPPAQRETPAVVGMVARIDPWKGHELVVRSFGEIAQDFPGVELRFAGGPSFGHAPELRRLEDLAARLGIAHRVKFLGHLDPSEVWDFVDGLDIAVHASLRPEPLGQNVLQYLARGRAIIAANAGGPAEWLEPGVSAVLYEPGSQRELVRALAGLLGDAGERSRLAAGAAAIEVPTDAEISKRFLEFARSVTGGVK